MSQETEIIKDKIDLAELIGEYVPLKKAGNSFKGLCPFHQEKTASFVVTPDKNIWHCFGCSEGGDHFSFVQKIEGIDFPEALKMLAERAGVELKPRALTQTTDGKSERTTMFELLDLAAQFYHEILVNHKAGQPAKDYLFERGVTFESLQHFQIGYAVNQWDSLQNFLSSKGFSRQQMMAAGLVGQSERGSFYDRFRGRVMFPIADQQGRVVGFGGRILPKHETGSEGKYVNTPETSLYHKREVIYNLASAKQEIRQQQKTIVVEGYLDVVMLWQIGVTNVVASSGTAFTHEQVKLIQRYANELHFSFDPDTAGIKAALAATQAAWANGARSLVIALPLGQDPADLVKAQADQAKGVFAKPESLISLLIRHLQKSDKTNRDQVLNQLLPVLVRIKHPVQQGEAVQEVANILAVPERVIIDQLSVDASSSDFNQNLKQEPAAETAASTVLSAEQLLAGLCLLDDRVKKEVLTELPLQAWEDQGLKAILAADSSKLSGQDSHLALSLGAQAQEQINSSGLVASELAKSLIPHIRKSLLRKRLLSLQLRLSQVDSAERARVLEEFNQITNELALMG